LVEKEGFSASIDGILGMQGKLPLRKPLPNLVSELNNTSEIGVRAAVDIPTGVDEQVFEDAALRADFTYATGITKTPLLLDQNQKWVGRLRYLDLGFFKKRP
jgi:NAD(P)H-hydrate epimerase